MNTIKSIKTIDGEYQIDYNGLANLPEISSGDSFTLMENKYSNAVLNEAFWAVAGSEISNPDFYLHVEKFYHSGITLNGIEIKLSTEDYTDYDIVLNMERKTCRLPLLNGEENLPSTEVISDLGLAQNPTNEVSSYVVPQNGFLSLLAYKSTKSDTLHVHINGILVTLDRALVAGVNSNTYVFVKRHDLVEVSTDSATTGWILEHQKLIKAQGNGDLYFYLGEAFV